METQETQENTVDLDNLLAAYKAAVAEWIAAIQEEERLALPDHSMKDWEIWDRAVLAEGRARGI
jgi:hypothetical protein